MNIHDIDINSLPDTFNVELYVEIDSSSGRLRAGTFSMAEYDYIPLGTVEIEVPVPKDQNPVELMVEALDKEAESVRAEAGRKLDQIAEKKAKLLALTWQGEGK